MANYLIQWQITRTVLVRDPSEKLPDPSEKLPDVNGVKWIWRTKKNHHRIGTKRSKFPIFEISTERKISCLSAKKREEKILEMKEKLETEQWKNALNVLRSYYIKKYYSKMGFGENLIFDMVKERRKNMVDEEKRMEGLYADFSRIYDIAELKERTYNRKIYIYSYRKYPKETKVSTRLAFYDDQGEKGIFFDDKSICFEKFISCKYRGKYKRLPDSFVLRNSFESILQC